MTDTNKNSIPKSEQGSEEYLGPTLSSLLSYLAFEDDGSSSHNEVVNENANNPQSSIQHPRSRNSNSNNKSINKSNSNSKNHKNGHKQKQQHIGGSKDTAAVPVPVLEEATIIYHGQKNHTAATTRII